LWQESHRPGSRGAFAEASGLAPPLVADVEKHMGVSSGGVRASWPASSCSAARLTWVDEIDTATPSRPFASKAKKPAGHEFTERMPRQQAFRR